MKTTSEKRSRQVNGSHVCLAKKTLGNWKKTYGVNQRRCESVVKIVINKSYSKYKCRTFSGGLFFINRTQELLLLAFWSLNMYLNTFTEGVMLFSLDANDRVF